MPDTKLYRLTGGKAKELQGESIALEKSLQYLIEANLDELLGIRFRGGKGAHRCPPYDLTRRMI